MAFGAFGFKVATRTLFKNNKAQNSDMMSSAQSHTNKPYRFLAKAKLKFKQQYRKAIDTSHRCDATKDSTTVPSTLDFTIPPINFPEPDFSVIAADALDTLQHMVVVDSVTTDCTSSADIFAITAPVVELTTTGTARTVPYSGFLSNTSVSTVDDNTEEICSADSACSTETALSAHTVVTTRPHQSAKPTTLEANFVPKKTAKQPLLPPLFPVAEPEDAKPDAVSAKRLELLKKMADEQSNTGQRKIAEVLNKLKAKLWPFHHTKVSGIHAEEEEEDFSDRCQWDIITKIKPVTIKEIVRSALSEQGYSGEYPLVVTSTAQGSYHFVVMLKALHPYTKKVVGWVVKIPDHGTPDRWTADDEYMLTQEVEIMRLLTMHTDVPSPWVVDYAATLNNTYGFPYIVMKQLPGTSANELWFEEHGEVPSSETEQKRLTFLRSLARHMTELKKVQFDQIGLPMYEHEGPEYYEFYEDIEGKRLPVNKYYVWPYCDTFDSIERGPFPSTQAYIRNALGDEELPTIDKDSKLAEDQVEILGTHKILDIIFSHPVFHSTPQDTFTLRHSDLDTQNILIDAAGNVTGILDWDASLSMPRCVGHASVPAFLDRDFYSNSILKSPFLCWRAGHYRSIYAAALVEAGNPDAKFTTKSHIYQAAFAALYEGGDKQDFVTRMLKAIPGLQVEVEAVKFLLSKGCRKTEEMVKWELWKVLDPELPEEGLLQGVETQLKEAAVQVWMDGFEGLSEDGADEM